MELLRICERNDINTRMNSIKLNISRNETTIERLKSQEKTEFNARQIDKLNEKNKYNLVQIATCTLGRYLRSNGCANNQSPRNCRQILLVD